MDDRRLPTVFALCEHQEKVVAAIELRKKHNEFVTVSREGDGYPSSNSLPSRHVELIDSLLDRVLDEHVNLSQHSSVTAVDLFYKNVIWRLFEFCAFYFFALGVFGSSRRFVDFRRAAKSSQYAIGSRRSERSHRDSLFYTESTFVRPLGAFLHRLCVLLGYD